MEKILLFLATVNCFPTINIVEDVKTFYKDGVIHLSKPITDAKIVHEFVHDCQQQWAGGPAKNWREWNERERHAKIIEMRWLEYSRGHQ